MIRLTILGSPDLVGPGGEKLLSVLSQPKRLVLLARLALAGDRGVRRDLLLAEFWPDSDDARARNALNQSLHHLRRSLGDEVLVSRQDDVVAVRQDLLWCDAAAFEDAVAGGRHAAATEAYTGPLLQGVGVSERSVEQWLEVERARLGGLVARAAWGAAEEALDAGLEAEATERARRAAALTPLDEVAARRLMELLARVGDRGGGLQAFRGLRARLDEELQVEPSAETVALAERLRSEPDDPPAFSPVPPPARAPSQAEPDASSPAPEEPPAPRRPRRLAVFGAAGAFALAGLGALAYQLPVSTWLVRPRSLVAQGMIEAGGRVLLTDLADATGEGLGAVVTEALRVDLAESSVLDVLDRAELGPALARMRGEPGVPLTAERGRQLALREGIPAVIDGDVARAGSGYLLTATVRSADSGRPLASFRVTAAGPDALLSAIDELSRAMRTRAGEPLRRIRARRPLAQVTTGSFEALRLYTEAFAAFADRNDRPGSAELLERALVHDSTFAMAWRLLAVALQGGRDPVRRGEAAAQAFRYRDRLPEVERYLVEGTYYGVVGDRVRVAEAYENVLRIDPDNPAALNNLAFRYRLFDDLERAEELLRRAVAGTARSSSAYLNLFWTQLSLDHAADAAATLREWGDAYPDYEGLENLRFEVLFLQGDTAAAATLARRESDDPVAPPGDRARGMKNLARLARWAGRLDEAGAFDIRGELLAALESPSDAWTWRVHSAYDEALAGDPQRARVLLRGGLEGALAELAPIDLDYVAMVTALVNAADPRSAERVLGVWSEARAEASGLSRGRDALELMTLYARVEAGDTADAAGTLERLEVEARCGDSCWIFQRARIRDRLGQHARAIEQYEKIQRGGYTNWGPNTSQRLYAMMRLGQLYEEGADTARAVAAYGRLVEQWAGADARGRETVRRFEERIAALGAALPE